MPDQVFTIKRENVPLWSSGKGSLTLNLGQVNPLQKLPPNISTLFDVAPALGGSEPIRFGGAGNLTLGVTAGVQASLAAIRATPGGELAKLLKEHGLEKFHAANAGQMLYALRIGARAGGAASGSFAFQTLSAQASVSAGGDGGYTCIVPVPEEGTVASNALALFRKVKLPSDITAPLEPGHVVALRYGGYLKFGGSVSAGFELKGTQGFTLGSLDLSERYKLSASGRLGLDASVAGSFLIEARSSEKAGWVRVIVRRHRESSIKIAADATVGFTGDLAGLPVNGRDFLGAALGVNVKNWFNVLDKVGEFSDLKTLESKLDGLANQFIKEYLGKAFGAVPKDFTKILGRVRSVVDRYQNLDNYAINLFDRYFDKLDILTLQLEKLRALTSLDAIAGEVDGELWRVLRTITSGDPLTFLLGRIPGPDGKPIPSLPELQRRVQSTLDLVQGEAHKEIREVMALAKESFPLDGFITQLARVDSISELKELAGTKAGNFAERLIGKAIKELNNSDEAKKAVKSIHDFVREEQAFEKRFNDVLKMAARQRLSASLHAEYSRATERDALIDVEINLETARGLELMKAAGRGDFRDILASVQPGVVALNEGVFSHKVTRTSAFAVNVVGWHLNWRYSGFDKVVTEVEQRITTDASGALTVFTTFEMQKEKERKRNAERVHTLFLLRFLGEASGAVASDPKRLEFFTDVITSSTANYDLTFTDDRTEPEELADYLSFARDFGLDAAGATVEQLRPLLPMVEGTHFGEITAAYQVGFTEEGLNAIFRAGIDEQVVRQTMRKLLLANYLKKQAGKLTDIAWCYATEEVHAFKRKQDKSATGLFATLPRLEITKAGSPIAGIAAPSGRIQLNSNAEVFLLNSLIEIENKLVEALNKLQALITKKGGIAPEQFEKQLAALGDALKLYDARDEGDNTVFAVFDALIRAAGKESVRKASLSLTSKVSGKEVNKVFVLPGVAGASQVAGAGS
ncbi:MAG: hypothetical protein IPJ98_19905 [Bryobacterales bacterium]|nr:hypothetical protein [Bryobacterales bacterium]